MGDEEQVIHIILTSKDDTTLPPSLLPSLLHNSRYATKNYMQKDPRESPARQKPQEVRDRYLTQWFALYDTKKKQSSNTPDKDELSGGVEEEEPASNNDACQSPLLVLSLLGHPDNPRKPMAAFSGRPASPRSIHGFPSAALPSIPLLSSFLQCITAAIHQLEGVVKRCHRLITAKAENDMDLLDLASRRCEGEHLRKKRVLAAAATVVMLASWRREACFAIFAKGGGRGG
ncbi:hypothetical protein ACLOJK_009266 [Asimina triloba]